MLGQQIAAISDRASIWALQEMAVDILSQVVTASESVGIRVLPVKGVVTSRWLYPDVSDRPLSDVDIRVRADDLPKFKQVAREAGWDCLRELRSYRSVVYGFGLLGLDVETGVGPPGLCALSVATMLERSDVRELRPGLQVPVPEIHDHAMLLTVNVFKDKVVAAPPWAIEDLARIVEHASFRADRFADLAVECRSATLVWVVAKWMEEVRASHAWRAVRVAVERRARVRRAYGNALRRRLHAAAEAPLSLRLISRLASDSRKMQLRGLLAALAFWLEQGFSSHRDRLARR